MKITAVKVAVIGKHPVVRIATDQARFVSAFVRRAILPDQSSTWLLPHLVDLLQL